MGVARRAISDTGTHASLCFLSFNRPDLLERAIRSATVNAGEPVEIIVHDDGSEPATRERLMNLFDEGRISNLILNPPGHNEGVGRAINRCFSMATGDLLIKLDQDLTFNPQWVTICREILDGDDSIAMLGLFRYAYDPVDWRKMQLDWPEGVELGYHYVRDFVGSAMVLPRHVYEDHGPFPEHSTAFAEDVEYKTMLKACRRHLALPDNDLAYNHGFGYGPSTVNVSPGVVQEIHTGPKLVGE